MRVARLLALLLMALGAPARAEARTKIVVLTFGGADGGAARVGLVAQLRRGYEVIDGERLIAACQGLGLEMKRGANLARGAARLGAVAVIGGSAGDGRLALAVYSGESGEPLVASAVRWHPGGALSAAMKVLREGLQQAPAQVGGQEPTFSPEGGPETSGGGSNTTAGDDSGLSFDPEPVDPAAQPDPGARFDSGSSSENENPLENKEEKPPEEKAEKSFSWGRGPRVAGSLGVGMWMRNFTLNDAVPDRPHPKYESGAAAALQLQLRLWPLAFFFDGIPAGFWVRLRYQTALGLSSAVKDGAAGLSTSLSEVLFDGGYDFGLGDGATSPHLDLGVGYGGMSFGIDWGTATPTLPAADYSFLVLGAGFRHPFSTYVGYHVRFDYRVVFGTGEIELTDPDRWYGPATTGGLAGTAGLTGALPWGITVAADYTYARYFYAFKDGAKRQSSAQRAAGGALDQLHSFVVAVGYKW